MASRYLQLCQRRASSSKKVFVEAGAPKAAKEAADLGNRIPRYFMRSHNNLVKMMRQPGKDVISYTGRGVDLGQRELTGITWKSHKSLMPNGKVLIAMMACATAWAVFHMAYALLFRPDCQIFQKRLYDLGSKGGSKGSMPFHNFIFDKHYVTKDHQERVTDDYKRGEY